MEHFSWKDRAQQLFIGGLLYIWVVIGILLGMKDMINVVKHPFLFWVITFFWVIGLLILLTLSDHVVYSHTVPLYREDDGYGKIIFLFMRRLFWVFLTTVPLLLIFALLISFGPFLISFIFSPTEEEWYRFLGSQKIQGLFLFLSTLYYWFFGIRFLFVDFFLLEDKNLTLLRAFFKSYHYCRGKRWVSLFLAHFGYFFFLEGGLLFLFFLPITNAYFWFVLAFYILIYQLYKPHLKLWEWKYWEHYRP